MEIFGALTALIKAYQLHSFGALLLIAKILIKQDKNIALKNQENDNKFTNVDKELKNHSDKLELHNRRISDNKEDISENKGNIIQLQNKFRGHNAEEES